MGLLVAYTVCVVVFTFALVNTVMYMFDIEVRSPDTFERVCIGLTLALGLMFCLATAVLASKMLL